MTTKKKAAGAQPLTQFYQGRARGKAVASIRAVLTMINIVIVAIRCAAAG